MCKLIAASFSYKKPDTESVRCCSTDISHTGVINFVRPPYRISLIRLSFQILTHSPTDVVTCHSIWPPTKLAHDYVAAWMLVGSPPACRHGPAKGQMSSRPGGRYWKNYSGNSLRVVAPSADNIEPSGYCLCNDNTGRIRRMTAEREGRVCRPQETASNSTAPEAS